MPDSHNSHSVMLTGEFAPGTDEDAAAAALAELVQQPVPKVKALLANAPVGVKKNVDLATAQRYKARIEDTGVKCRIERSAARAGDPESLNATPGALLRQDSDSLEEPHEQEIPNADNDREQQLAFAKTVWPHRLPAGRGGAWVAQGWQLFCQCPGVWIAMTVIYGVVAMALNLIPFAFYLLHPLLVGGVMLGCEMLQRGKPLKISYLFRGFDVGTANLIKLGALYLVAATGSFGIAALALFVVPGGIVLTEALFAEGQSLPKGSEALLGMPILITILVFATLFTIVLALFWFAPALVMLQPVGAIESIKLSFAGCIKNMVPFLVYGAILLVLGALATIPLGLGWLVLGPVFMASIYASYRDIYQGVNQGVRS